MIHVTMAIIYKQVRPYRTSKGYPLHHFIKSEVLRGSLCPLRSLRHLIIVVIIRRKLRTKGKESMPWPC